VANNPANTAKICAGERFKSRHGLARRIVLAIHASGSEQGCEWWQNGERTVQLRQVQSFPAQIHSYRRDGHTKA
jgi:hypothetical protein